ncbi:TPA: hypothetical protein WIB71_001817, partial [Neisseria meningitidis]
AAVAPAAFAKSSVRRQRSRSSEAVWLNSIEIFLGGALRHFNRFGRQGQKRPFAGRTVQNAV